MTELKMKSIRYYEVDYNDLETFIKNVTGHDYEIPSSEECGNDSNISYNVKGFHPEYDSYRKANWEDWKKYGEGQFLLKTILDGLAEDDKIPMGQYLIRISW